MVSAERAQSRRDECAGSRILLALLFLAQSLPCKVNIQHVSKGFGGLVEAGKEHCNGPLVVHVGGEGTILLLELPLVKRNLLPV